MSAEENKATLQRREEAWNGGELDALDPLFASDFAPHIGVPGLPPGLASAKQAHQMSMQTSHDRRTTIEDLIAEGDTVMARMRMTGTNQGGLAVDVQWISIDRLSDGQIAEHWAVMDVLCLMQQLGSLPSPGLAA